MTTSPESNKPGSPGISPEVIYPPPDEARIELAYDKQDLDDLLSKYAFNEPYSDTDPSPVTDSDIQGAIAEYAVSISLLATGDNGANIPLLRTATDRLTLGMNIAASQKVGFKPPKSKWQWVLMRTGVKEPEIQTHFHGLDERYWESQFPRELSEQVLVKRGAEEDDSLYLARHLNRAWQGLLFAPFSYLQSATRSSAPAMIVRKRK